MNPSELIALLEAHPAPWEFQPGPPDLAGEWQVVDAAGRSVQLGDNDTSDRQRRFMWRGLADAVNVAADYLEVLNDLLEEQAEEDSRPELPAAELCAPA